MQHLARFLFVSTQLLYFESWSPTLLLVKLSAVDFAQSLANDQDYRSCVQRSALTAVSTAVAPTVAVVETTQPLVALLRDHTKY